MIIVWRPDSSNEVLILMKTWREKYMKVDIKIFSHQIRIYFYFELDIAHLIAFFHFSYQIRIKKWQISSWGGSILFKLHL